MLTALWPAAPVTIGEDGPLDEVPALGAAELRTMLVIETMLLEPGTMGAVGIAGEEDLGGTGALETGADHAGVEAGMDGVSVSGQMVVLTSVV